MRGQVFWEISYFENGKIFGPYFKNEKIFGGRIEQPKPNSKFIFEKSQKYTPHHNFHTVCMRSIFASARARSARAEFYVVLLFV